MSVQGFAEMRPLEKAGTVEETRAANRRVVVRVE